MLDSKLLTETSATKRRQAVKDQILRDIADGTFTITDTLLADQPLQSDANEVLDGVVVEGTRSLGMHEEALQVAPVLLACVNPPGSVDDAGRPNDKIKYSVAVKRRVPGTTRETSTKEMKDFGNFAFVANTVPARLARCILYRDGSPIRQSRMAASASGTVIEWAWLDREVKSGNALEEHVALHAEILSRKGFAELIGGKPRQKQTETTKVQATAP